MNKTVHAIIMRMSKLSICNTAARSFAMLMVGVFLPLSVSWADNTTNLAYEGYYLYLGDYPGEKTPFWESNEPQGVAHDSDHWFITSNKDLWKIPVNDN